MAFSNPKALFLMSFVGVSVIIIVVYLRSANEQIMHILPASITSLNTPCTAYPSEFIKHLVESNAQTEMSSIEDELAHLDLKSKQREYQQKPKVSIIVPYKNREANLKLFIRYIHEFLYDQNDQLSYAIYLVEPMNTSRRFNRGMLLNIGFVEVLRETNNATSCFIFHDVDMLPENKANIYDCSTFRPRQMAIAVSSNGNYKTDGYYTRYFGGVNAFTREQFYRINGHSNIYFGWGAEDDDVYNRVISVYEGVDRLNPQVGRYFANCHADEPKNVDRFKLLNAAKTRFKTDGLNSLNYTVEKIVRNTLFTHMFVNY